MYFFVFLYGNIFATTIHGHDSKSKELDGALMNYNWYATLITKINHLMRLCFMKWQYKQPPSSASSLHQATVLNFKLSF